MQKILTILGLVFCALYGWLYYQQTTTGVWQITPTPMWYQVAIVGLCAAALLGSLLYEAKVDTRLVDGVLSATLRLALPFSMHLAYNGTQKLFDVNELTNVYGALYVAIGTVTFIESFVHIRNYMRDYQVHSMAGKVMAFASFAIFLNEIHDHFSWLLLLELAISIGYSFKAITIDNLQSALDRSQSFADAQPLDFSLADGVYGSKLILLGLSVTVCVMRFWIYRDSMELSEAGIYLADVFCLILGIIV